MRIYVKFSLFPGKVCIEMSSCWNFMKKPWNEISSCGPFLKKVCMKKSSKRHFTEKACMSICWNFDGKLARKRKFELLCGKNMLEMSSCQHFLVKASIEISHPHFLPPKKSSKNFEYSFCHANLAKFLFSLFFQNFVFHFSWYYYNLINVRLLINFFVT